MLQSAVMYTHALMCSSGRDVCATACERSETHLEGDLRGEKVSCRSWAYAARKGVSLVASVSKSMEAALLRVQAPLAPPTADAAALAACVKNQVKLMTMQHDDPTKKPELGAKPCLKSCSNGMI